MSLAFLARRVRRNWHARAGISPGAGGSTLATFITGRDGDMRRPQPFRDWTAVDSVAIGVALLLCLSDVLLLR